METDALVSEAPTVIWRSEIQILESHVPSCQVITKTSIIYPKLDICHPNLEEKQVQLSWFPMPGNRDSWSHISLTNPFPFCQYQQMFEWT